MISPAPTMTTLTPVEDVEFPFKIAMMKFTSKQVKVKYCDVQKKAIPLNFRSYKL
jgi:hypothetical protein